jgi:hypothetical protein
MEWILHPPGAHGGYLAMVLLLGTIIYMGYAFIRYR